MQEKAAALREIIRIFGAGLDLKPLLAQTAQAVARLTGADSCLIYVLDPERRELVLSGSSSPHPRQIGRIKMKLGEGITGWVAEHETVVALPERAYEDPRFKFYQNLPEDRYEAFFSVPLKHGGQLLGVMNIQHQDPHRHTEEEIELLQALANMVAGAIANARLYEETRRRAKHLEALFRLSRAPAQAGLLEEALGFVERVMEETLGLKRCRVFLFDPVKSRFWGRRGQRITRSHPIYRQTLRSVKPFQDPQEGAWVFPLTFGGKWVGLLLVYPDNGLEAEDLRLIGDLAAHVSLFLRNLALEEEIKRAREALETRKVLDRAKLILIQKWGVSEEEAHRWLQREAMNRRLPLRQVAEAILIAGGLLDAEKPPGKK